MYKICSYILTLNSFSPESSIVKLYLGPANKVECCYVYVRNRGGNVSSSNCVLYQCLGPDKRCYIFCTGPQMSGYVMWGDSETDSGYAA